VTVLPLSALYVPNSFTPNNDGINDNFKVSAVRLNEYNIIIVNRWNEIVFQSYDHECYWDGIYGGKLLPSDVYYYEVAYRDVTNKFNQKKGTITLIK
jgi:gliding motility-associated-like protein